MSNISTAVSNVIPFDFRGHSVRAITIDGEPWFVASDVCKILKQSNTTKALHSLDGDERSNFKLGRQGLANIVSESGLYTLILRCDDAIKKGSDAHAFRKWVTAEVLPAIRKHGRYEDVDNNMKTLLDELIGMSELSVIKGLIRDKGKTVPADKRQSFALTMHSRLHTRFNVPRTELIPAGQFEAACNFIAAYSVLEGEYMPKGGSQSVDIPSDLSEVQRYLVFVDGAGKRQVRPVPFDACVMSPTQFLAAVVGANGIHVSPPALFDFALAALEKVKRRVAA
ncbi:phage repressor protein [Pseudomonas cichorii]|uniref:BRO-N domain-containing protein n=1 Tax=Pseudomonas cichorii TaxID=36746 RepID=UPI001C8A32D2|nr:Bro-N domain-containing protein [Pseudomonas cichorii]MBX8528570.1 phage repressor protein [Pseudomonas cichorii]